MQELLPDGFKTRVRWSVPERELFCSRNGLPKSRTMSCAASTFARHRPLENGCVDITTMSDTVGALGLPQKDAMRLELNKKFAGLHLP